MIVTGREDRIKMFRLPLVAQHDKVEIVAQHDSVEGSFGMTVGRGVLPSFPAATGNLVCVVLDYLVSPSYSMRASGTTRRTS